MDRRCLPHRDSVLINEIVRLYIYGAQPEPHSCTAHQYLVLPDGLLPKPSGLVPTQFSLVALRHGHQRSSLLESS